MQPTDSKARRKGVQPIALVLLASLSVAHTGTAGDTDSAAVETATLEVLITGFRSAEGRLAIALFTNEDDYSTQKNAVRKAWLEIRDAESSWRIGDLPTGEYALIAYHDENGNQEIDMRLLGMPKESVGVSNDARGFFGPPRFRAARFEVVAPLTRHAIELR